MSIDESKRLRRNYLSFTDFPDTILKSVTDYLFPVSQALFAVALSAPSTSASWWTSNIKQHLSISSKAIISNGQWDVLDFGTGTLTAKLNDDDIRAVLVVIDARNKLKRLYLINCNPITYGLQPLEGSIVLEQLDLDKNQESMSVEAIVPFLVSIIDKHDNSLKHLTLPNVWRHPDFESRRNTDYDQWRSQTLNSFMRRYHGMLEYRPFNCAGCNGDSRDCTESAAIDNLGNGTYHIPQIHPQSFTCYECLRNFSVECDNRVLHCTKCERGYCGLCAPRNDDCVSCSNVQNFGSYECFYCLGSGETETCGECGGIYCIMHKDILPCQKCDMTRCRACAGGRHMICRFCSKSMCFSCRENDYVYCSRRCGKEMCSQCIDSRGNSFDYDCVGCNTEVRAHLRRRQI